MGKLTAVAVKAALANPGTYQDGDGFPGMTGKAMSNMTLLKVMRDMQEPFHVHGFRSSFTDWAANEGFPNAVVEAALAHKTPDAVQAAYRRTTYLGTADNPGARVKLMEAWGSYCSGVVATKSAVNLCAEVKDCHDGNPVTPQSLRRHDV